MFLMHRVELKVPLPFLNSKEYFLVPNAPCGVEREYEGVGITARLAVPNAPCGVEREVGRARFSAPSLVPNAPCGVERQVHTASPPS